MTTATHIEASSSARDLDRLSQFLAPHRALFVLTGAGCSTESGIPDYRDADGAWKHRKPMKYQEFVGSVAARQRYWSRSLIGWERIASAQPNPAHGGLARLEEAGRIHRLVTQNVDRLHSKAGSRRVIDLHGRLDRVECLGCHMTYRRDAFQEELRRLNPLWQGVSAEIRPDGDADLSGGDESTFQIPQCPRCGGMMKPGVVFFGENIPRHRVEQSLAALDASDAVLVAGSSLMVYSGYRFVRQAARKNLPVAILNLGRTRGDDEADLKVEGKCGDLLPRLAERLAS